MNYGTRAERLWKRVDRSAGPDACWPWTGSVNPKGYGDLGPGPGERTAHRIAYASTFGAIPPGLCVLHRCDNPPCCNPDHLWLGTHKDNSVDMVRKGRSHRARNERSGMVKLSNAQVDEIRQRWRRGEALKAMAPDYGVHPSHLSRVVRGVRRPPEGDQRLPAMAERPAPVRRELKSRKPRKPRTGPTPEEKARRRQEAREARDALWELAVQLYEQGLPTTEIARRIGRDSSRVSVNLRMRGVQMRAPHSYEPEVDREAVTLLGRAA